MKYILTILLLTTIALKGFSQTYLINNYHNQTITSCSGTFYDSGGPTGNYVANQDYTVSFVPNTFGTFANLIFTSFNVGIGCKLEIFDGADINAPLIGIYNNGNSPVGQIIRPSLFNPTGKLTVRWRSVATGVGWAATVACGYPCQDFTTVITSSTPPYTLDSGIYYIDICPGDSVSLHGTASFPYNNYFYHQDSSTTTFSWNFNNSQIINGQNISAVLNNPQGYNANIVAVDTLGCFSQQASEVRIRVSTQPTFTGTDVLDHVLCQNDTTVLQGIAHPTPWEIIPSQAIADTTYLPDGTGVSYTSILNFSGFNPTQVITSASDIQTVFAEIEHSYLGDLNIVLKCPNNSSVTLKSYPGGTNTYLGEPIDNNALPIPGLGYMYHWTSTGSTTMLAAAGTYTHNFTDVLGTPYTNASYIPPSTAYPATSTAGGPFPTITYLPETPFTGLIGCPINGSWSIVITDNLAIDNGYIFSWGIDFSPAIVPVAWGYVPIIDSTFWNVGPGDTLPYQAITPGPNTLTYSMIDRAGCQYDTNITIMVNPYPDIDLGNDTSICINDSINLAANDSIPGSSYLWSTGSVQNNITLTPSQTATYWLKATSSNNCIISDSIEVAVYNLPQIQISDDTLICFGTQAQLTAMGGLQYLWSTGDITPQINVSPAASQLYNLNVVDSNNCAGDTSVFVTVAPLPNIIKSNDTIICLGTNAQLKASGGTFYQWSTGSTTKNITVSPAADQLYGVIVSDTNSCTDSATILVEVIDWPIATLFSDFDTVCSGGLVTLTAGGGMVYLWEDNIFAPVRQITPLESNDYSVIAINSKGTTECTDTASVYVHVEQCALFVPSAFSPNGDGINDDFAPIGIISHSATYEFVIFDRWGRRVFYSQNPLEKWDGKVDGQYAASNVYTYVINVVEPNIKTYQLTGTVHVIR